MAKINVNGVAKEIKQPYVNVNGVPKTVTKVWCNVKGVAKVVWENWKLMTGLFSAQAPQVSNRYGSGTYYSTSPVFPYPIKIKNVLAATGTTATSNIFTTTVQGLVNGSWKTIGSALIGQNIGTNIPCDDSVECTQFRIAHGARVDLITYISYGRITEWYEK